MILRLLVMVLCIICLMDGHANVTSSTTGIRNGEEKSTVKATEKNTQIIDRKKKKSKKPNKPKKKTPSQEDKEVPLANDCNEAPLMPNIGYIFQGYDIYKGNPLQEETLHFDPGLRQPIFKAIYGNKCTSDLRRQIPDGTTVLDCSGCSLSFSTTQVSDITSYEHSLSLKVSAEGGGWGAAFSASYGHKNVESKTHNSENIFTQSEATCCSYKAQILNYMLPTFSEEFIYAIQNLPERLENDVDKEQYQAIIDTFGTHYINEIIMGSLFGQETEISIEGLKALQEKKINIDAAASYSGFSVTASAKFASDSETTMAREFQKTSTRQRVYTIGPPPPEGNNMEMWVQGANKSPGPISQNLKSIISLLERQQSVNISEAVMENLRNTFDNYCEYLRDQGLVSNCHPKVPLCRATPVLGQMSIFCEKGTTIHITSAVWRTNVEPCGNETKTLESAREVCEGHNICSLSFETVPYDTCETHPGPYYHLYVCHTCEPVSDVPFCMDKGDTTEEIEMGIGCYHGTTVNITFALWGRPADIDANCPGNETTSTKLANSFCQGQTVCALSTSGAQFPDPCEGVKKTLYMCNTCIV